MSPLTAPLRRPRVVLLIALVVAAASLLLASRSRPTSSLTDLIGKNDPAARALQRVLDDFPSADELLLLVTLRERPATQEQGARQLREFAAKLSTALASDPVTKPMCRSVAFAAGPQFVDFFTKEAIPAGLLYLSDAEFNALIARLKPDAMREQLRQDEALIAAPGPAADALSRTLLKDPLRLREFVGNRLGAARAGFRTWRDGPDFISPDGLSILIRVAGVRPPSDLAFCKEFTAKVTRVADALASSERLTVSASGAYAIAATSEAAIRHDLISSVVGSLIVMQVVFLLGFRNVLAFLLAMAPVAVGLCAAFGVHALITPALTPLTAVIGASLAGCAVDYSIYVLSYHGERDAPGAEGLAGVLRGLIRPLLAAAATSIVGFVAVAFSSVHALRDFAVLGALGLTLALAGVVWVLPAMLLVARVRAGARVWTGGLVRSLEARPRVFIALGLLLAGASVAGAMARPIERESDLAAMHPVPNAPLDTQRTIAHEFGVAETMMVLVEGKGDELVHRSHEVARAVGGSASVMSLHALLPDPEVLPARRAAMAAIDAARVLGDFDSAVAQSSFDPGAFAPYRGFLKELLTNTGGPTLDTLGAYPEVASLLVPPGRRDEALAILSLPGGAEDARARDAAVESLRAGLRGVPGATLTGLPVISYDVEHAVARDLPRIVTVAAVLVLALLLASLRSVRLAALACVPVVFGLVVLMGYAAVFGEKLNLANTVAVPLLLGVGIDYGIFLCSTGRPGTAAGFHAILLTSTTSIIGFGSFAFTSTPAIASMGRVVAVGIAGCVLGVVLLLAPVLSLSRPTSQETRRR